MKDMRRLFAAGAVLFMTACTTTGLALLNFQAAQGGGYSVQAASYGSDPSHKLDIYIPDKTNDDKKDVIVFFYGGRWQSGKKEDYLFVAAALARRGFIIVIPDFRKYPDVRFPVFVEDGAKALAWVDDHIAEYGGRRDRIHLAGHSSGAHMAALLTADKRYLVAEGKDASVLIKDFAGLAGPYAFTPDEKDLIDMFGPPDRFPQMQVTTFIDGTEPPMLLLHGLEDDTVKIANLEKLAERINEKKGRVQVITYKKLGHAGIITTFSKLGATSTVVDDVVEFFRR